MNNLNYLVQAVVKYWHENDEGFEKIKISHLEKAIGGLGQEVSERELLGELTSLNHAQIIKINSPKTEITLNKAIKIGWQIERTELYEQTAKRVYNAIRDIVLKEKLFGNRKRQRANT